MPDMIDTMAYNRSKGAPWHGKGEVEHARAATRPR